MANTSTDGKKKIHFIRHAQSVCNALRSNMDIAVTFPVVPDPGLTYKGMEQARHLKEYLAKTLKPEVAICSPYTRTMHTCLLSYGSENVVITPLCGEIMSSCDDVGLPASCLKAVFTMFDFSSLDEIWWYVPDGITSQNEVVCSIALGELEFETNDYLLERLAKFYTFLEERPEKNIAVYAHSNFLTTFLQKYFDFSECYLENCRVYSVEM